MIVSTTIGGIDVELFLVEPDWIEPVSLELNIDVDASMGETGKEARQPESLHPRYKMSFTPDWTQSDLEDIQTLAATVGTKRIAMPIFPDTRDDITDDFLFSGQHYVSWDGAGSYAVDANTYDNVAPLMFGYLGDIDVRGITDEVGKQTINFFEDSPWSHRVSIVSAAVDGTFTLEPNRVGTQQKYVTPIEHKDFGQGRERLLENQEDSFKYEQSGSFLTLGLTETAYLLNFWADKKGRLNSFTCSAFFQPSTATAETPDAFKVRFKGEKLKLDFKGRDNASTNLSFIQLPWELANPDDEVSSPRCYAFDFAFGVPGKSNIRLIDWEQAVTISSNSYSPYKMTMQSMTMGTRLFNEEAVIAYAHEADNPLLEFVEGGLERLVTLTILEGDPSTPSTFSTVFVGSLKSLSGKGRSLTAKFAAFGGLFEKRLPGFAIQAKCNYVFGDANCGVNVAALGSTGTSTSSDLSANDYKLEVNGLSGTLTAANDPDGNPGDRFAGGYIEVGSGDNYQIRLIRKTEAGSAGTDRIFTLNRPVDSVKLDASDGNVTAYPGCGGSKWQCLDQWSNYANFGGHPFVPEKLDAVQGETPSVGK